MAQAKLGRIFEGGGLAYDRHRPEQTLRLIEIDSGKMVFMLLILLT